MSTLFRPLLNVRDGKVLSHRVTAEKTIYTPGP